MKHYYLEYETNRIDGHSGTRLWLRTDSLGTAKESIAVCRFIEAERHPHNFRVYDCYGKVTNGHVPCVYHED